MERRHLFEREMQQRALEEFDGLARIRALVDWEAFVPSLEEIFGVSHGGPGRPAWDPLVMFRSILLGVMHSLSDRDLQFMLLDRRTFKRFAGLQSDDQVPDQKTLWKYRDLLSRSGRIDELFELFKAQLRSHGYELTSGQLVDSSIVEVPRQRNSREDNRDGEVRRGAGGLAGQSEQAVPEGHRCALDEKAQSEPLWLQEPYLGGPGDEVH